MFTCSETVLPCAGLKATYSGSYTERIQMATQQVPLLCVKVSRVLSSYHGNRDITAQ